MASLNLVQFIGNAGKDAELRYTPGGSAIAKFSLAVNHKSKGEESTEWLNIVLFGETAEKVSQYITKGKSLYVSGRLQTRTWADDQGVKHYMTEILANTVQLLGGNPEGQRGREQSADDSLPFE